MIYLTGLISLQFFSFLIFTYLILSGKWAFKDLWYWSVRSSISLQDLLFEIVEFVMFLLDVMSLTNKLFNPIKIFGLTYLYVLESYNNKTLEMDSTLGFHLVTLGLKIVLQHASIAPALLSPHGKLASFYNIHELLTISFPLLFHLYCNSPHFKLIHCKFRFFLCCANIISSQGTFNDSL